MEEGLPYRHIAPSRQDVPLLVEVPHASTCLPAAYDGLATELDVRRDADLFVDELYDGAHELGAHVLCATYSRYVIDLNRAVHDIDPRSVEGSEPQPAGPLAHGLVWSRTTRGDPALRAPLTRSELAARINRFYLPYHGQLEALLEQLVARFGYAILLAAHSMPNQSLRASALGSQAEDRADVVPGTRGRTTASGRLIACVEGWARSHALSIKHDTPYAGGYTTAHYGNPGVRVHAIQIELNRRLYMDESTLKRRTEGFARTRSVCLDLVKRLGAASP